MPKKPKKPRGTCVDPKWLESAFELWGEIYKAYRTVAPYPKLFADLNLDMRDDNTRKALFAAMRAVDRRRDARGDCMLSVLVGPSNGTKEVPKPLARLLRDLGKVRPGMSVGEAWKEQRERTWDSGEKP